MRFNKSPKIKATAITHAGMSGKNNEDRYRLHRFITKDRQEATLAVVADGIGGHRAGEVAAELTSEQIVRSIDEQGVEQPILALERAIQAANQLVLASARSNPQWAGMGSTCACALIIGNRLYTVTAGDSRIYLLRKKQIFQLNRDHTWIQEAIDLGTLPPEIAYLHPNAHVVRRYIGAPNGVQPDTRLYLQGNESDRQAEANQGLMLKAGDQIVVCSDGLTDLVASYEILAILRGRPLERGVQELVNLANQRGGHDNITIVALQVGKSPFRILRWIAATTLFSLLTFGIVGVLVVSYLSGGEEIIHRLVPTATSTESMPVLVEETSPSPVSIPTEAETFPTQIPTFTPQPSSTWLPSRQPTATFTPWPTNTPEP